MSDSQPTSANRAVFLSYARDAAAALLRIALAFAAAALGPPSLRAAERKPFNEETARQFAGIAGWIGFWEAEETETLDKTTAPGLYTNSRIERRGSGEIRLQRNFEGRWDPQRGEFEWIGTGSEQLFRFSQSSTREVRETGFDLVSVGGGVQPVKGAKFGISLTAGTASVNTGYGEDRLTSHITGTVYYDAGERERHATKSKAVDRVESETNFVSPLKNKIIKGGGSFPFVQSPGQLNFSDNDAKDGPGLRGGQASYRYRSRVVLCPIYDDVEVEVTIEGYAAWRPKGSIEDTKKPGNGLVAHAVLKSKAGNSKDLPKVARFRFELLETSREPGVCLNWPLGAKDDDYDLKFADLASGTSAANVAALRKFISDWGLASSGDYDAASLPAGGVPAVSLGEVSEDGQKAELADPLKDKNGRPFADAAVESFDFGGRAELRVTCFLQDGREIIGLLKSEGGQEDLIRLPKMKGPDWIAECWRKEKKVEQLAASDDNEKVAGQKDNGDGFTLYEEYRGWVENGKHIEGDPERKDFFVLNMIGADGRPGIELFETLSQLRVHSKLRRWEMSPDTRLMNGNHRDAPHHRVDQHGVWIKTFTRSALGDKGAATSMTEKGVAGRPGITKGVGILARGDAESIFNQPFNLPVQDVIFAYDRAIAHELLHSVGVEHHGLGDRRLSVSWVSPRHPRNNQGRPFFRGMGADSMTVFQLLDEKGNDLAILPLAKYAQERERWKAFVWDQLVAQGRDFNSTTAVVSPERNTPEKYAEYYLEENISFGFGFRFAYVGERNGEHSGDQDCLMRYYFAEFYPTKGTDDTYYQVTPGTERIGIEICRSGAGTGINASSHKPQARYGNAAAGAGDCFSQICPNDAIPPRSVK